METNQINFFWLIFCAGLVFLMQAGFLVLETGLTRNKNNINIGLKNLSDFALSTMMYWLVGYGLMFGQSRFGLIGTSKFLYSIESDLFEPAFFIFQVMFCGTAVTIISGTVAERMRFGAYLLIALIVSTIIYPIYGHWVWNGIFYTEANGWLAQLGFVDFAGSTVVHSIGGWLALALGILIGPRLGRFPKDGAPQKIPGSNISVASLGVLLLWVGWIGFNGGSTLALNRQVPFVLLNTIIAGSAGLVTAMGISYLIYNRISVALTFNGSLAGLVAITANAHVVSTAEAVVIGGIGAGIMVAFTILLERRKIDDVVGAIPVHLGGGVWGTLAVGIFGSLQELGTGLSRIEQIGIQSLGIGVGFIWAFVLCYFLFSIINRFFPLRVTAYAENIGLNVAEHNAKTPMVDLVTVMEKQAASNDLSLRVPVEPFTEIGQIAQRYNQVINSLEETVKRNNIIIQSTYEGIVTFAAENWQVTSLNPAGCQIFGFEQYSDVVGRPVYTYFEGVDRSNILMTVNLIQDSKRPAEATGIRVNGEHFPVEMTISKIEINNVVSFNAIFRDISKRKEIEANLSSARDKAIEASQLKSQFLATISHELRTPLNAILGMAEMVELGIYGDVNENQKRALSQIMLSTNTLESLVNELLDQAQLESGQLKIIKGTVNLRTLISRTQESLSILADAKGITLTSTLSDQLPEIIIGDEMRLVQIITNLVGNSIKFTDTGYVKVDITPFGASFWEIKVTDSGIGISAADQDKIFEAFRQTSDVVTRDRGGFGLGLAIVKQLVHLMNGKIQLNSVLGRGTEFIITLPLEIQNPEHGTSQIHDKAEVK